MSSSLEMTDIRIGFVPLADAAPIIMAKECGIFEKHGLNVTLEKVSSWARMRDLLAIGDLQVAHMLAPMVIASVMGLEPNTPPFTTAMALNMNGNAITISNALYAAMYQSNPEAMKERPITGRALRDVVAARITSGQKPLTFAMVYPFSSHNYQLRYWLAAAGLHPDRDVNLVVVPPPKVMDYMKAGIIDGYCVGEPWNSEAVDQGVGTTLITSHELMGLAPEKVLGVCQSWADDHPKTYRAILSAVLETSRWLENRNSLEEAASIMSLTHYVGLPAKRIVSALTGARRQTTGDFIQDMPDFNVFYRYAANFPWRSHASWFMTQMYRWGQVSSPYNFQEVIEQAYRSDIFREVAKAGGHIFPTIDMKNEGEKTYPWVLLDASSPIALGANQSIDNRVFRHSDPIAYMEGFQRHSLRLPLSELAQLN
ncbi:MAG: CmpA/NrtA family ABC transporter substrate-binding protein [Maricaulaceae bacterium]